MEFSETRLILASVNIFSNSVGSVPSCPTMTLDRVGSYPTYQNCSELPSPPEAVVWKPGLALQFAMDQRVRFSKPP